MGGFNPGFWPEYLPLSRCAQKVMLAEPRKGECSWGMTRENMAGQHSKEPLPMSQNHIIRAWMSHTGGWVLTATNAYSELAPDSNILCDAGIGTAIV